MSEFWRWLEYFGGLDFGDVAVESRAWFSRQLRDCRTRLDHRLSVKEVVGCLILPMNETKLKK